MPATPKEGVLYLNVAEFIERFSNGLCGMPILIIRCTDLLI